MAVNRCFGMLVLALVPGLASCSTGLPSAGETRIVAQEGGLRSEDSIISSASPIEPSAPPRATETAPINASLDLLSPWVEVEERSLRPQLAIDDEAARLLPDMLPKGAAVSYVVVDLERGDPIAQRHADRSHIPASSAKLATAVVALKLLGPEHRFVTEVRTTGTIENGVLKGDLILKGGSDPLLDIPDFLPLIDSLARLRVRRIEGKFLIDDTQLPRFTEIEPMQPNDAPYNPGIGALSLAFNRVNLQWENRSTFSVETVPQLDEASFETAVPDDLPPSGVQLKRFDGEKAVWQLADRGSRRSKRSLPVKDPGLHAGLVFADLARLYGIDLPAPERAVSGLESQLIAARQSRPLRELVRDMLWYSNNLMAELIGLSAAKTLTPELASLEGSADIILSALEDQIPDLSWETARLVNHSGLSSKARLSPRQLGAILRYGWKEGMLSRLLPGSGWSGTLARRFSGPDQAFRIWAKTGSLNYVTTLGGYLLSSSHSPAAFVIMISDSDARAAYDALPQRTRAEEKKARAWQRDAEEAMNFIVGRWLEPPLEQHCQDLALAGGNRPNGRLDVRCDDLPSASTQPAVTTAHRS